MYNHLSYDNGSEKIQSKNKLEDLPELFEQVNQILTTVLELKTVNFIIELKVQNRTEIGQSMSERDRPISVF
ncbi:DUF4809 family protein [Enterococcus gallinarum]|nr:DUF4809 family protein [Enterococcus gallinarum]